MDALRFLRGISTPPIPFVPDPRAHHPLAVRSPAAPPSEAPARNSYMLPRPIRRLWPAGEESPASVREESPTPATGNWVMSILRVRSLWANEGKESSRIGADGDDDDQCGGSDGCAVAEEAASAAFDRESFSRLLRRVSLMEAEFYAKMSHLSNLAYNIPGIKPPNLLKLHGLRFVTSSLEKKTDKDEAREEKSSDAEKGDNEGISASDAYQIAASAASYLQSQTKDNDPLDVRSGEEASFVATTNSITAVVSGKEEMKQAVAENLRSSQASPCEWFICDDDHSGTRYFVIQGSETLASWQANLLFEPVHFEGLDVLVHRGIYEAAKGIYQQMLPEIQAHLRFRGNSATLRFTGHSLGGSLALLLNLMLLIRGEATPSSLLPVITFGAPSIMCGGDSLFRKLGLSPNHLQAVMMHRDIVPRAFSCNYPDHVAKILTALNGNFRNHPCLKNQKLLYAPMGKLLILQPEEKFSPHHHLLPPGAGLYLLDRPSPDSDDPTTQLQHAQSAFLNSPHPLEILSDRSAYGSDGTVYRDHDVRAYLRSVRSVIRQELKIVRRSKKEQRLMMWWPIVGAGSRQRTRLTDSNSQRFGFGGAFREGRETLRRFGRMVTSRHINVLLVLLLPARLFIFGALSAVSIS